MERIDELKTRPIVGEYYQVPCVMEEFRDNVTITEDGVDTLYAEDTFSDYELKRLKELYDVKIKKGRRKFRIFPILNHKHSDTENGQDYSHYHIDYRFVELEKINERGLPVPKKLHTLHEFAPEVRYNLIGNRKHPEIEYYALKCIRQTHFATGGGTLNSKDIDCLKEGRRCPHRGYNLSQEVVVRGDGFEVGAVTCPLHGLVFNLATGKRITDPDVLAAVRRAY